MAKGIGKWYIEIEKQAFWRGNPHTWVNRYIMSGEDPPAVDAITVMDGIGAIEDKIYPLTGPGAGVGFVEYRAYASTGGSAFATIPRNISKASTTATGFGGGSGSAVATWADTLEVCILAEAPVVGLSSTGKPVHLRKYYRGLTDGNTEDYTPGRLSTALVAALNVVLAPLETGIAGTSYTVQPQKTLSVTAGPFTVQPFLVNHQIPRGRKRKTMTVVSNGVTYSVIAKRSSSDIESGTAEDLSGLAPDLA